MARSIDSIAREIAEDAISIATCAGYEIKPEREVFARSDMLDLAEDIAIWLEQYMQLATPEDAE